LRCFALFRTHFLALQIKILQSGLDGLLSTSEVYTFFYKNYQISIEADVCYYFPFFFYLGMFLFRLFLTCFYKRGSNIQMYFLFYIAALLPTKRPAAANKTTSNKWKFWRMRRVNGSTIEEIQSTDWIISQRLYTRYLVKLVNRNLMGACNVHQIRLWSVKVIALIGAQLKIQVASN